MPPFTRAAFLGVFAAYNERLWLFAVGLWILTAYVLIAIVVGKAPRRSTIAGLLTVHWAWAGLAYHVAYFSAINPAAWVFGGLFLLQAGLFAWYGLMTRGLRFYPASPFRRGVSLALISFALVYPAVALLEGHTYPAAPTFGVPCPTTILTIGFLVGVGPSLPIVLAVIPVIWSAIGGSAALLLGVRADLALGLAGILLVLDLTGSRVRQQRRLGGRQLHPDARHA
jgi:hypothetical protein